MRVDIAKRESTYIVEILFLDFKTSAAGENWQQAMATAMGRAEVEMALRLHRADGLDAATIENIRKKNAEWSGTVVERQSKTEEDRKDEDRWAGLELVNGEVIGAPPKESEEGQVPCKVCGTPTWGNLCACCQTFVELDQDTGSVKFHTPHKTRWTRMKIVDA